MYYIVLYTPNLKDYVLKTGSVPSAGGCTTRTRICLTWRRWSISEDSVWRTSWPVTTTPQTLCVSWKLKVKDTNELLPPQCISSIYFSLLCTYRLHLRIRATGGSKSSAYFQRERRTWDHVCSHFLLFFLLNLLF